MVLVPILEMLVIIINIIKCCIFALSPRLAALLQQAEVRPHIINERRLMGAQQNMLEKLTPLRRIKIPLRQYRSRHIFT